MAGKGEKRGLVEIKDSRGMKDQADGGGGSDEEGW